MSRNRRIFLFLAMFIAFLLQVAVLPQFKILGVQPDLILVVAVTIAIQEGPIDGAIVGFFGGMLQDIVGPMVMGVGALTKTLAAFFAGLLKDFFMTYSILLPVILVFIFSLIEPSMHHVALVILGQEELPPFQITVILLAAIYNVVLVFIVYPILRRFRFPYREESLTLSKPGAT